MEDETQTVARSLRALRHLGLGRVIESARSSSGSASGFVDGERFSRRSPRRRPTVDDGEGLHAASRRQPEDALAPTRAPMEDPRRSGEIPRSLSITSIARRAGARVGARLAHLQKQRPVAEAHFREVYQQHYGAILAYALRRCRDHTDAQDVAAETFLVAWRRLDAVPDGDESLPWLYGVARRVLANHRRGKRRRDRLSSRLQSLPHQDCEIEPRALASDAAVQALSALSRLHPRDQEVLRLAAWEGLSHAQMASVLGWSENASAIRLHRARQRLAKGFEKESVAPGHETDSKQATTAGEEPS